MHKEYIWNVENADTAVLFIHGIVGTPNHFKDFIPLVPKEMSVHNILLDGHGKGVKDFSASSMKKWKNQIETAATTHRNIIIVAHSMGTLFAIQQAVKKADRIKFIFLLASPLKLFIKPRMAITSLKVYLNNIKTTDYKTLAAKNAYGIEDDRRIWRYIGWFPRYLELFKEIRKTRRLIKDINIPCYIYQSKKDEMVSFGSIKLLKNNPNIHLDILKNSTHYYYEKSEYDRVLNKFISLI